MKRFFVILVTLLLVISLSAGCGRGTVEPERVPLPASAVLSNDINVCYSLFPIAFADSNGDGLGDINGIRENLGYLKDELGVDCIWLNPVHPSPTYHKYDVTDYLAIDPDFGTMEDYENLLDEMHDMGMYMVMDLVINHTSSKHPWFQAAKQKDEKYRDYYRWLTKDELKEHHMKSNWYIGGSTYYYAGFWSEMPELNLENEAVREEIKSIAGFWLDKGVDGFRIDAAKHLFDKGEYPEGYDTLGANIEFLWELNEYIKSRNEDAFIISEVIMNFNSASSYYESSDALFNFDFSEYILEAAYVGATDMADRMQYYMEQPEGYEGRVMGTLLSNHDQNRSIEALAGSISRARVAVNLMLTLPGLTFISYGEEIGMKGRKPDENIREPFVWGNGSPYTAAWNLSTQNVNADTVSLQDQMNDESSLFSTYSTMIRIRRENPVLKYGDIAHVDTGVKAIIAYRRFDTDTNLLVVHNTLNQEYSLNFSPASDYEVIYSQDPMSKTDAGKLLIAGRSVVIIDLEENDINTLE